MNRLKLSALLFFSPVFYTGCRRQAIANHDVTRNTTKVVEVVTRDTTKVVTVFTRDTTKVLEIFKDTAPARIFGAEGREFQLQTAAQRQAYRALVRRERQLWEANKPREYQFLLRVDCFCPGVRGWQLIDVRSGQPLRAFDRNGKPAPITDWNTLSIDALFDNLERTADQNAVTRISFDPRWHFPAYVRTSYLPGPDAWSIYELRAFRRK